MNEKIENITKGNYSSVTVLLIQIDSHLHKKKGFCMIGEVNKLIKKAEHALEVAKVLMGTNYPSSS